jgi:hypothetical protein
MRWGGIAFIGLLVALAVVLVKCGVEWIGRVW